MTVPKERPGEVVGGDAWIVGCLPRTWQVGSETDLRLLTSYELQMAEPETRSGPDPLEPEDHRCISEVRH